MFAAETDSIRIVVGAFLMLEALVVLTLSALIWTLCRVARRSQNAWVDD